MHEDVAPQATVRLEPAADAPEELAVVAQMLEAFDRDHAVEALLAGEVADIHGLHPDVRQPALSGVGSDVGPLRVAVGNRVNTRIREAFGHVQRQ